MVSLNARCKASSGTINVCYRTPDCGQRRSSRLTSGNLAPQDVDNGRCPIGENFLYVFKGARSAPRAWRRVTAQRYWRKSCAHSQKRARRARGEPAAPRGGRSP
jgi:hypothetical protein